jgi:hypothetical protein
MDGENILQRIWFQRSNDIRRRRNWVTQWIITYDCRLVNVVYIMEFENNPIA